MVLQPREGPHTHTIILLHGRGSDGSTFAEEFLETQDSDGHYLQDLFPHAKLVFPTAKPRPWASTGEVMPQWFDMQSTDDPHAGEDEQLEALKDSVKYVRDIIQREAEVVGYENIVLGGISQGCATAIHVLRCLNKRLGCFVGFAGWLPFSTYAAAEYAECEEAKRTPVHLQHCRDDEVIRLRFGEELRDQLKRFGVEHVEWRQYEDGGHWVNEPQGFEDMVNCVQRCGF